MVEFVTPPVPDGGLLALLPAVVTGGRFFLGDNRRFSDDPSASARIHTIVTITGLDRDSPGGRSSGAPAGEHRDERRRKSDRTRHRIESSVPFVNLRGHISVDPNGGVIIDDPSPWFVQIDHEAAANLPLLGAPDIDMLGVLQIDRDRNRIRFRGADQRSHASLLPLLVVGIERGLRELRGACIISG
jgi:hypothetical protein